MKTAEERFFAKVEKTEDCWIWTAATINGYGRFAVQRINVLAHKWLWETINGPVPVGLTLDHLCRNRACVRPDHLEPVTNKVNLLRGVGFGAINARKTHCIRGHEFTDANTYRHATTGQRVCRTCKCEWSRSYRHRKAAR